MAAAISGAISSPCARRKPNPAPNSQPCSSCTRITGHPASATPPSAIVSRACSPSMNGAADPPGIDSAPAAGSAIAIAQLCTGRAKPGGRMGGPGLVALKCRAAATACRSPRTSTPRWAQSSDPRSSASARRYRPLPPPALCYRASSTSRPLRACLRADSCWPSSALQAGPPHPGRD